MSPVTFHLPRHLLILFSSLVLAVLVALAAFGHFENHGEIQFQVVNATLIYHCCCLCSVRLVTR